MLGVARREDYDTGGRLPRLETSQATERPIARSSILVVAKRSRFEREQSDLGLSDDALIARYGDMGDSGARILGSHERQRESKAICEQELTKEQVVHIEDLGQRLTQGDVEAIIALGGDDFLKLVSLEVDDVPVLGVNSDPLTSDGVLLSTPIERLASAIRSLESGCYRIEPWTRIKLRIDGKDYGETLNDVVFGKRDFRHMSRHELEYRGEKLVQKCSGILISSGSGSTGWFSSAGVYLGGHQRTFDRTAQELRFELREPQVLLRSDGGERRVVLPPHCEGIILPGEALRITSLNDAEGIASRDSLDLIPFQRGVVAEISVSDKPLNMIVPGVAV